MDPFSAIVGTGLGIISSIFGSGGPSATQEALNSQDLQMVQNLSSMTNQRFAQQSQVLNQVQSMLSNPAFFEQPGMSAQEYASRQAGIISGTGLATTKATQNTLAEMAGRGGGASGTILSGPEAQVLAGVATEAQIAQTNLENQLTTENYAVGRQLGEARLGGELKLADLENPVPFANATTNAASVAGQQASDVQTAKNAKKQSEWGGVTSSLASGMSALMNPDAAVQATQQVRQQTRTQANNAITATNPYPGLPAGSVPIQGDLIDPYASGTQALGYGAGPD